jgi:acyl-CoA thioesterase
MTMPVIAEFVQGMLADDRGSSALGIELLSADGGVACARLTVLPSAVNGHGIGHGGIVFALADTAFACAANSVLPGTATADASIVYHSPARVGDVLLAEARVRHRTSRQVFVDVAVRSGDRLVADYRGRGVLLPAPVSG